MSDFYRSSMRDVQCADAGERVRWEVLEECRCFNLDLEPLRADAETFEVLGAAGEIYEVSVRRRVPCDGPLMVPPMLVRPSMVEAGIAIFKLSRGL